MNSCYRYKVLKIVKIVDGDTVDCDIDLGFYMVARLRFRLLGVDTPERGQSGFSAASDRLAELLNLNKDTLIVETKKTDVFGRWLGTFFSENFVNINEIMADEWGKYE